MKTYTKKFNQLSVEEIYGILKLRSEVFVVEQNCVYQDLDGKDELAIHLFYKNENEEKKVTGFSKIYKKVY